MIVSYSTQWKIQRTTHSTRTPKQHSCLDILRVVNGKSTSKNKKKNIITSEKGAMLNELGQICRKSKHAM